MSQCRDSFETKYALNAYANGTQKTLEPSFHLQGCPVEGKRLAANPLPCRCPPQRDGCETLRKSDGHWKTSLSARTKVIPKAVDLVHAFVQDGHDPDVAIREMTPVH